MQKKQSFKCEKCLTPHSKWQGLCSGCQTWNTIVEIGKIKIAQEEKIESKPIDSISVKEDDIIDTKINELNRVLGGGLTSGSLILLSGEPGVGKSTLLMKISDNLANEKRPVLYVSGEESLTQVARRSRRLDIKNRYIRVMNTTKTSSIAKEVKLLNPCLVIIDSIQTTKSDECPSGMGSPAQMKEVVSEIINEIKLRNISCILTGHINKEGNIAGPKYIEHMVDTVLSLEQGDVSDVRVLNSSKNRFGNTSEIGIFKLSEKGIEEVGDHFGLLVGKSKKIYSAIDLGSRIKLIEIQSLFTENNNYMKPIIYGTDHKRALMLLKIFEENLNLDLSKSELLLRINGLVSKKDTGSDLGIMYSLYTSLKNKKLKNSFMMLGEVNLLGEVLPVSSVQAKISAFKKSNIDKLCLSMDHKNDVPKDIQPQTIFLENLSDIEGLTKILS